MRMPRLNQQESRIMTIVTPDKKKGLRIYEQRMISDYYDVPLDTFKQALDDLAKGLDDVVVELYSDAYNDYGDCYSENHFYVKGFRPLDEKETELYESAKKKQAEIDKMLKERQKTDAARAKAKREQDERKQYEALKRKYG